MICSNLTISTFCVREKSAPSFSLHKLAKKKFVFSIEFIVVCDRNAFWTWKLFNCNYNNYWVKNDFMNNYPIQRTRIWWVFIWKWYSNWLISNYFVQNVSFVAHICDQNQCWKIFASFLLVNNFCDKQIEKLATRTLNKLDEMSCWKWEISPF